jgi:putative pyruvate formate lyase activating enzyme
MSTAVQSRERFSPSYPSLLKTGELARRGEVGRQKLGDRALCPRNCHVDRLSDKSAVCCTGRHARVSSYFAHFGEEDCLRGTRGSGTVFFSGCNLRCVFCQNFEIGCQAEGEEVSSEELAGMMLALQERGCHNINQGHEYQAIEQNLEKPSRWEQLARSGHQVVQFKDAEQNKFVAVVVDGEVTFYGARKKGP